MLFILTGTMLILLAHVCCLLLLSRIQRTIKEIDSLLSEMWEEIGHEDYEEWRRRILNTPLP